MGLYRKKPVVIEARKWDGSPEKIIELGQWASAVMKDAPMQTTYILTIPTLEGEMTADIGDYIIKGVKGEFYPCKPDIFLMTYEEV